MMSPLAQLGFLPLAPQAPFQASGPPSCVLHLRRQNTSNQATHVVSSGQQRVTLSHVSVCHLLEAQHRWKGGSAPEK